MCRAAEVAIGTLLKRQFEPIASVKQSCPTSSAHALSTEQFGGFVLGAPSLPVAPLVASPVTAGSAIITARRASTFQGNAALSFKTLWLARPSYAGPFLVRGRRLDQPGSVRFGERGERRFLAVRGPTTNGRDGYREVPGETFVDTPGCYAWEVDSATTHYSIVFEVV
jgi:hypothetical protein